MVEMRGVEPRASCVQSRRSTSELHPHWWGILIPGCWWGILDSNQGPQSYQDCALTT